MARLRLIPPRQALSRRSRIEKLADHGVQPLAPGRCGHQMIGPCFKKPCFCELRDGVGVECLTK